MSNFLSDISKHAKGKKKRKKQKENVKKTFKGISDYLGFGEKDGNTAKKKKKKK